MQVVRSVVAIHPDHLPPTTLLNPLFPLSPVATTRTHMNKRVYFVCMCVFHFSDHPYSISHDRGCLGSALSPSNHLVPSLLNADYGSNCSKGWSKSVYCLCCARGLFGARISLNCVLTVPFVCLMPPFQINYSISNEVVFFILPIVSVDFNH